MPVSHRCLCAGNTSSESVVQHYLSLHMNVISISESGLIELKLVLPSHMKKPVADEVMLNAATNLILSSYRNQLLHVFVQVGMLSLVVNASPQVTMTMGELTICQFVVYIRISDLTRLPPRDSTLDGRWTRKPFGLSRVQPI